MKSFWGRGAESVPSVVVPRESEAVKLKRTEIAHDSMALFAADQVEVFIKTAPAAEVYYQFAVGAFGARYAEAHMSLDRRVLGRRILQDIAS